MDDDIPPGYTRISAVASFFSDYGDIDPDVLQNAADRGSRVHEIIEKLINNIPPDENDYIIKYKHGNRAGKLDNLTGYVDSWLKLRLLQKGKFHFQEKRFYDHEHKLTGKIDALYEVTDESVVNGKGLWVLDWKTSSKMEDHWKIQAGGYAHLLFKGVDKDDLPFAPYERLRDVVFVRLSKLGDFPECINYRCAEFVDCFLEALETYQNAKRTEVHDE